MARFSLSTLRNKHILALAGNGTMAVVGFLILALLARCLGKTDLGIWFYFLTICSTGDAIRSGLLGTATIKFYAGTTHGRAQNVLGSVWYLAILVTVILAVIDLCFLPFIRYFSMKELAITVQWFGITFISSLPFNVIFWILVAEERYGKMLWLRMLNNGSMVLLIGALYLMHRMTLDALLWINLGTNVLTSAIGIFWGLSKINTLPRRTKACTLELFHFGKYSLGTTLSSNLFRVADTNIITFMLGASALPIYFLPLKLMEIVEFPLRSFVGTGMSAMAIAYNNNNEYHTAHVFKKYTGMLTVVFIPMAIFIFFFADIAINLMYGSKYAGTEAANIYRLLMIVALAYPIDRFTGAALDIIHKPKINFYKVQIMLCINCVFDYIGLALFKNIYGVVFASYITIITGAVFGYIQLRRYMQFTFPDIMKLGYAETVLLAKKVLKRP